MEEEVLKSNCFSNGLPTNPPLLSSHQHVLPHVNGLPTYIFLGVGGANWIIFLDLLTTTLGISFLGSINYLLLFPLFQILWLYIFSCAMGVCVCVCGCEFKLKHCYLTLKGFIKEFPNMYKSRYNSIINLHLLINQLLQMPIYCQFQLTCSSLLSLTTLTPH